MPRVFSRVAAGSRPLSSATSPFPPAPVSGAARRWRAPESRAGRAPTLLRCLAPAPRSVARWPQRRNELGLHIRHPAYRPDPTIPRRRHQPADQWRSERRRGPCTFRLGSHAPLGLTADAQRPPAEEIMSIGGAHGARRGTGPTYLDCPLSREAL